MRTLVVSDLHIGAGRGRPRLDEDAVVEKLAAAAAQADRLVLLGDIVELRQRPVRDALAAASRVLPRVVGGLGPGREVILVAGNHDHELFAPWATRRAFNWTPPTPPAPIALETAVDWADGEPLAAIAGMLASSGASVRAAYPGVWLRDDVYATHGHYLDRHTTAPGMERLGAGLMSRLLKLPADELRSPDDYERILAPIYAWMLAVSDRGGPEVDAADGGGSSKILRTLNAGGLRGRALQIGVNAVAKGLQLAGLGELSGDVSGAALHRTENRGFGIAMTNIGVEAEYLLFGHTHRAGPFPGDDPGQWTTPAGARLLNSGCWVNESSAFVKEQELAVSAYRAGFAIELDDAGPPRLVNLLER